MLLERECHVSLSCERPPGHRADVEGHIRTQISFRQRPLVPFAKAQRVMKENSRSQHTYHRRIIRAPARRGNKKGNSFLAE